MTIVGAGYGGVAISYGNKPIDWVSERDWPLMQYAGLKDKNGVEIYCGDLLAFEAREWYREAGKEDYIFEVSQSETGEWVGAGICTEWSIYCEVIGNIYSNPELIEKVKI